VGLLKETGWDAIEVRVGDVDPAKSGEPYSYWGNRRDDIGPANIAAKVPSMKAACAAAGIPVCGLAPYINATEPEKFEPLAAAAAGLGARTVRIASPWYRGDSHYDELFKAGREGLKEFEAVARKHGVVAAVEVHMGGITAAPSAARRFVDGFDPACIGVILDPGNMVYEGFENWRMSCEILGPYLSHVHVKNAVWTKESDNPPAPAVWKPGNAPMREGQADWAEVMKALRSVGYKGYLSLEDFTPGPQREKLASTLAFLKSL
jgi:sugar phosphate isomerase/epimerase